MSKDHDAGVLTAEEQHMISRVVNEDSGGRLMFEVAYLFPAGVLVGLGLWHESPAAFASAFAVVLTFRIWMVVSERKAEPVLRSAVRKLSARAAASDDVNRPPG